MEDSKVNYWMMKTEPEAFSFADLVRDGKAMWDGVRNYTARLNLMAMKKDDLVLIYHSVSDKEVVGIAKVSKEFFIDPTQEESEKGRWVAIEIKPVKALKNPVTLATVKSTVGFEDCLLIKQSRLSVLPLSEKHYKMFLSLSQNP